MECQVHCYSLSLLQDPSRNMVWELAGASTDFFFCLRYIFFSSSNYFGVRFGLCWDTTPPFLHFYSTLLIFKIISNRPWVTEEKFCTIQENVAGITLLSFYNLKICHFPHFSSLKKTGAPGVKSEDIRVHATLSKYTLTLNRDRWYTPWFTGQMKTSRFQALNQYQHTESLREISRKE